VIRAALALAAAAAAQPQQFDVSCHGPGGADGKTSIAWTELAIELRVDLAGKRWCEGDCKAIHPIAEIQPASIWLEHQSEYERARQIVHFRTLNRETGGYTRIEETRYGTISQHGQCTAKPFSGFLEIKTKF
jgi:hypothetical protein